MASSEHRVVLSHKIHWTPHVIKYTGVSYHLIDNPFGDHKQGDEANCIFKCIQGHQV